VQISCTEAADSTPRHHHDIVDSLRPFGILLPEFFLGLHGTDISLYPRLCFQKTIVSATTQAKEVQSCAPSEHALDCCSDEWGELFDLIAIRKVHSLPEAVEIDGRFAKAFGPFTDFTWICSRIWTCDRDTW
jgi:hypothetical protein